MCHPAYLDMFLQQTTSYNIQRINELDILCNKDLNEYLQAKGIQRLRYSDL